MATNADPTLGFTNTYHCLFQNNVADVVSKWIALSSCIWNGWCGWTCILLGSPDDLAFSGGASCDSVALVNSVGSKELSGGTEVIDESAGK